MNETEASYPFLAEAARILNSGVSRSLILCGNVHDLFYVGQGKADDRPHANLPELDSYQPLGTVLSRRWQVPGILVLIYELNGPIRFQDENARAKIKDAWVHWKAGATADQLAIQGILDPERARTGDEWKEEFERHARNVVGNSTLALEFMRQLCLCSRDSTASGKPYLSESLLILVEAADLLMPEGNLSSLSRADRHRLGILFDWFSDPGFQHAQDSVVLIAESRSLIHPRLARLPFVVSVDVPAPDAGSRTHYLAWFLRTQGVHLELWAGEREVVAATAGLSLHALRQLLLAAAYGKGRLTPGDVVSQVEVFIQQELGEDVVEFKRPEHGFADVVGFRRLKEFLEAELIPRFRSTGKDALTGAAVCGPIGGGKTFIFEAVAGELEFPVLVLKNLRSQWFGQTDVIFERLRRSLQALGKVMIFVDEADTQFGGVGPDAHATERRLTGKIQAMISDPALHGKVVWLLMTARIHRLSPDLRRPGRVGDLIIPILDPEGEDRDEFLDWMLSPLGKVELPAPARAKLDALTEGYSAASYASLRSALKAAAIREPLTVERTMAIASDLIPPSIAETRRYQTLQALVNCTRRSLLPHPLVSDQERTRWEQEIRNLEARGIG